MQTRILVVDDELSMREFLTILLEREGFSADHAESADTALRLLNSTQYDLIISDVSMPGLDGMALLAMIKKVSPETAVLLITAFTTSEQAVEAMKLGAYDYIGKPFKVEEIKVLVKNALEKRNLQRENQRLKKEIGEKYSYKGLIGKSRKMCEIYELIEKVSGSLSTVLICGESGTGKELVARAIHYSGPRSEKPFVGINCGAIPETLIESELFGHKKGSFTGAIADRPGIFEQAEGGTLFLDEIGEVPLHLQTKLLRVLQERQFRRIGEASDRKADVRIVAASNKNLEEQVKEGGFREDLFYRLNVVQIEMPALRQRTEDIPLLVEHFHRKYCTAWEGAEIITSGALKTLMNYPFPGNVRELENLIERCLVLGKGPIMVECLPQKVREASQGAGVADCGDIPMEGFNLEALLDSIEKRYLLQALEKSGGVKKKAADLLGMTFRSFRYRLAKFGMDTEGTGHD